MQENNLFVGGLSWGTNDDTLMTAFSQAGTVKSAKVIMDKETGKSRGFGFVEMGSDEEAQAAIKMFDGQEIDGRKVGVNVARPRSN
jgi:cold-inducible RNA-binding protein